MLEGFVSLGDSVSAHDVLLEMEEKNLVNDFHYALVINLLGRSGSISDAATLVAHMQTKGVRIEHTSTCAQVMWVLCSTGKIEEAMRVYEDIRARGLSLEAVAPQVLQVLVQYSLDDAVKLLQRDGPNAGVDAYATVVEALKESDKQEQAILLLRELEGQRLPLTQNVVFAAVKLFDKTGHVQTAKGWVAKFEKEGGKPDERTITAMLAMLLHHGYVQDARNIFATLRKNGELTVVLYNEFILGLVRRGLIDESRRTFEQMSADGIKPDGKTMANLARCAEHGLLQVFYLVFASCILFCFNFDLF
jgi:pentatricopeptide repeat protein